MSAALALSCSPSLLDDCRTSTDCAEGVCEEGYCVPRADAAVPLPEANRSGADAHVEPRPTLVGECPDDRSEGPLYARTGEPCVVLDATAVWSFEGNYSARGGAGGAFNANSNEDGLAVGALTYVPSPFDQAASFFGSDDRWQGASVRSSVRNAGPMTIEAWMWLPATSAGGAVISTIDECDRDSVSAGWQIGLRRRDEAPGFWLTLETWDGKDANLGGSVLNIFEDGIALAPAQWHHIAVVFEGEGGVPSRVWAWADGFELGVGRDVHFGRPGDASWLHFGTRAHCVAEAVEMQLDAVRIMSRALTRDELNASNAE